MKTQPKKFPPAPLCDFPAHQFNYTKATKMLHPPRTWTIVYWAFNVLLAAAFVAEVCLPQCPAAVDGLCILLAAAASIVALNRQLPLQNVLPAAAIAAVGGALAHGLSGCPTLALPFGPVLFSAAAGGKLLNFVPWTIPLIWIIAIYNARGVARLSLRPWRKVKKYGFWLIGLTAVLAVAFDLAMEPFAVQVKHFWRWQPTKIPFHWHGATPLNFIGWIFVSVLILTFASPLLIRKQPGRSGNPDFHPLVLWLGALLLFAVGAARAHLWSAAGVDGAIAAVTVFFAVRGAKW